MIYRDLGRGERVAQGLSRRGDLSLLAGIDDDDRLLRGNDNGQSLPSNARAATGGQLRTREVDLERIERVVDRCRGGPDGLRRAVNGEGDLAAELDRNPTAVLDFAVRARCDDVVVVDFDSSATQQCAHGAGAGLDLRRLPVNGERHGFVEAGIAEGGSSERERRCSSSNHRDDLAHSISPESVRS